MAGTHSTTHPLMDWKKLRARRPLRALAGLAALVSLVVVAFGVWGYARLRASLPRTAGRVTARGAPGPLRIDRDALGVPTIRSRDREGLSYGLGRFLDIRPTPLPGGWSDVPRIQRPDYGASERLVVAPGREGAGIFQMPCGQSGHPLSPHYADGHAAWVEGHPTPLLPGPDLATLTLVPDRPGPLPGTTSRLATPTP